MVGIALAATVLQAADTVVVKVMAVNPSSLERRKVPVKVYLPRGARSQDVQDASGLEIAYDVQSQLFYAHGEFELETNQVRVFEVRVQDVWVIPPADLQLLGEHADQLAAALKRKPQAATADRLHAALQEALQGVEARQRDHALGRAKPPDHIRAYEANQQALERVRKDLGLLENLVLTAGLDPKRILGSPAVPPAPAQVPPSAESTNRPLLQLLGIRNPSLTLAWTTSVRRLLPAEITPADVLDAAGLGVGFDAEKRLTYVYLDELPLAPQEERTFELRLRNPWADAGAKVEALTARVTNVLAVARRENAPSAVDLAQDLARELDALKAVAVPAALDEAYVATERDRARQLAEAEERLARLEELFQPRTRPFIGPIPPKPVVRPPDERTTWILIWSILGFLFVLSLLFFFRWFGRSKADQVGAAGGASGGSGEVR